MSGLVSGEVVLHGHAIVREHADKVNWKSTHSQLDKKFITEIKVIFSRIA